LGVVLGGSAWVGGGGGWGGGVWGWVGGGGGGGGLEVERSYNGPTLSHLVYIFIFICFFLRVAFQYLK